MIRGECFLRPAIAVIIAISILVCLLMGSIPFLLKSHRVQRFLYPYLSTNNVISDFVASDWSLCSLAWSEIGRRFQKGRLTARECQAIERGFSGFEIRLRPRVLSGDEIPFELIYDGERHYSKFHAFRAHIKELRIDGKPCLATSEPFDEWLLLEPCGRGSFSCSDPGIHKVDLLVGLEVILDPVQMPQFSMERRFQGRFEVLPEEPKSCIKWIDDPAYEQELQKCIKFGLTRTFEDSRLSMSIDIDPPPVNIAFEVLIRVGGREFGLDEIWAKHSGGWTKRRRGSHGYIDEPEQGARIPKTQFVDVIFRSSEAVAKKTVNLYEIWGGEIVFEDVPVSILNPGEYINGP